MYKNARMLNTTWTAPYKLTIVNGRVNTKPVRNQIDFILVNRKYLKFVTNARSYNNINTNTDHNLVITNMRLQLPKLNIPKNLPMPQINIDNFQNPTLKAEYQRKLIEKQEELENENESDNTTKWANIVEKCLTAGEEALGKKEKQTKKSENTEIKNLSETNKRLKNKIYECKNQDVIMKLKLEIKKNKDRINNISM